MSLIERNVISQKVKQEVEEAACHACNINDSIDDNYWMMESKFKISSDLPGKGVPSHAHALVHASQHWEVRLIARLFIKNLL